MFLGINVYDYDVSACLLRDGEIAFGASQTDAYAAAGYVRDDGHASRLAGDGRIPCEHLHW